MRLAAAIILCLSVTASSLAQAIDVLQDPDFWVLENTSEGIYTIDELKIRAKRRSNESATILSREDYENFRLSFELQHKNDCELILLLHAPRNGAYAAGQEIVISEHEGKPPGKYVTGAILDRVAAPKNVIKRYGQWNTVEVVMDWPRLKVTINDTVMQDLDLESRDDLKYTLRTGAIGFRDLLGWGYTLRNIQLEELPETEGGFELFNGKNFDGWKEVRPGNAKWRIEDGVIIGENGDGYLQHEIISRDFDLRLYYQTTPTANGGVFFRWKTDDSERGNEIQLLDVPQAISPSGTVYNIQRANGAPIRPGAWNLLQARVINAHAVVHINGVRVAESRDLINIWPGHITLQMHKTDSTIRFKDPILVTLD